MTVVVLLILAALWAAYLIPLWLRSRGSSSGLGFGRPGDRTGYGSRLAPSYGRSPAPMLGASRPGWSATLPEAPRNAEAARRRRREVLLLLAGLAVVTLLVAVVVGGTAWIAHLGVDACLFGFGYLVYERESRAAERAEKVTPLAERRVRPEPLRSAPARRSVG